MVQAQIPIGITDGLNGEWGIGKNLASPAPEAPEAPEAPRKNAHHRPTQRYPTQRKYRPTASSWS